MAKNIEKPLGPYKAIFVDPPPTTEPKPVTHDDLVWKGAQGLVPLLVDIETVVLDPENARRHPERNIEGIKTSLDKFGQNKPIVTAGGFVTAGNGLVMAAHILGWTHIASVDASHLTEAERKAYGLADNKLGELSEWDFEAVGKILNSLPTDLLDSTGYADFERNPLMQAEWKPPTTKGDHSTESVMVHFSATQEQAVIIRDAIEHLRGSVGEPKPSDGRSLELICESWIQDPNTVGEIGHEPNP